MPASKEKHFPVTGLIIPELPGSPVAWIEIEAVHSGRTRCMAWRELTDPGRWIQGWR
jgi:tryptophan-rich hypothetical protein